MSTPAGRPAPGGLAASGLVALDEDHHVHSTFSDDAVSTVAENVRAARERGLRVVVLADHVRQGSPWVPDFVAAVRELRARARAGGAGRGGSEDPQPRRGAGPAPVPARGGPGADRGPPVPRRPRPGPAAGHAGRAGAPPVLGGRRHRRPHRGHPRRPGAGRAAAAGPPVQPAAQDGPGRGGCARRRPGGPGPGLLPGRGAGRGQREVGVPVAAHDPGPGRGRGAPGRQHRQPRLRDVGRYARVREHPRGGVRRRGAADGRRARRLQLAAGGARHARRRAHARGQLPVPARRRAFPPQPLPECAPYFPRTAILVPAWNEAAVIGASIDRLMQLDYPPDALRVFVVDDASTDDTPDVIKAKAVQYPGQVVHLRRDKGGEGKSHTLNHGLRTILARRLDAGPPHHGRRRHLRAAVAAPDDPAPGRSRGRLGHRLHQGRQPPGQLPDPVHRLRVHHRPGGRPAQPGGARARSPAWPAARSCTPGPTWRPSAAGWTPARWPRTR